MKSERIFITHCPLCAYKPLIPRLEAEDYLVSHEKFELLQCTNCGLVITQRAPDEESIDHYYQHETYISHTDTSKGLIAKLYKLARRFTLGQKRRWIEDITGKQRGSLLDVGSGTGRFLAVMKQSNWRITGIEPNVSARQIAAQLGIESLASKQLFTLQPASFDAITLWHVLEHVHDLPQYLHQFYHLLQPNGFLVLALPNYTGFDSKHYGAYWAAYDVPRHLYHFSPKTIAKMAADYGFALKKSKPLWLDAFYIALLSEKYHYGHTRYLAAAWVGIRTFFKTIVSKNNASSLVYFLQKTEANG